MAGFGGNVRRIATVLTASDQASGALDDAEKSGDAAAESMGQAESRADALQGAFVKTAAATAALAGTMGLLVRRHGQTEQTFARLQVVAGATDAEMESLRGTAMELGVNLPIAMSDAADAMEQLAFAGFEAEEAVQAANGVANLAVASNMNMSQSARTTASTLRMFNLEAEETHQVTATMAAVFSSSATTISELSNALEMTGATAQAAGISMQEVAAAVGVLGDQGIRASRAGTALNATLQRITTGSGQAQAALSKLGLTTEDFLDDSGQIQSLEYMLTRISGEMDNLENDAERLQVATELAGRRGARALLPLLDNTDKLNEKMGQIFRSEIKESIGTLNQLSEEELANVEEALDMEIDPNNVTPQALVDRLYEMNEAGKSTEEMARRLSVGLNINQEAAQALAEDVEDSSVSADQLAESIGGATTASEIAASQMSTTAGMVEFMRSSFDAMTWLIYSGAAPAIGWFNEQLAVAINVLNRNEGAMVAVGATMAVLTGALGAATLALGAMIVEMKLATFWSNAYMTSTKSGAAVQKAWTVAALAKNKATWLMTASMSQLVAATAAKTTALWASVSAIGASAAASLTGAGAMGIFSGAVGIATAAVTALWTALGPIGLLAIGLTAIILGLAGVMKFDLFGAGDKAAAALGWLGDAAGTVVAIFAELLGIGYELARILGTALVGGITGAIGALTNPDLWMNAGRAIVDLIVQGLTALGPMKYAIPILGPLLLAKDVLTDPSRWINAGEEIVNSIVKGIKNLASNPIDTVMGIASGIRNVLPFSDAKEGPLSNLTDTGGALIHTIVGGIEDEGPKVKKKLAEVLGATPAGDGSGLGKAMQLGTNHRGTTSETGRSRSPIMLTLEQTVNLNGDMMDPEEIREIVRDVARDGGKDALKELQLILEQATGL